MKNLFILELDKIKKHVYLFAFFIIYIIYALVFFAVIPTTPAIVHYLTVFVQFFVSIVLMVKFHPFREKYELKEYDGEIIFGSALIILANLGFAEFMINGVTKVTNGKMI